MTKELMVQYYIKNKKDCPLPTYNDMKHFIEYGQNDDIDLSFHRNAVQSESVNHGVGWGCQLKISPHNKRDLVELLGA